MKNLIYACAFLAAVAVAQQPTAVRVLKADVLRDFPDKCFGSTVCRVFEAGGKWPLFPFCGEAKCLKNATGLFEEVTDCGPRVKENEECKVEYPVLTEEPQPFPHCCPKVTCIDGAKPTYYSPEELKELAAKEQAAQEAKTAAAGGVSPGPSAGP